MASARPDPHSDEPPLTLDSSTHSRPSVSRHDVNRQHWNHTRDSIKSNPSPQKKNPPTKKLHFFAVFFSRTPFRDAAGGGRGGQTPAASGVAKQVLSPIINA